ALLRAPRQRLPVHGSLPAARRDDRGGDPDVRPHRSADRPGRTPGAQRHLDDGARGRAVPVLRIRRVRRGVVRAVRPLRGARVPGLRADGGSEARRAVRGDVPSWVRSDRGAGRGGRDIRGRAVGGGGVRMSDAVVARTGTAVRTETGPGRRWSPGGLAGALVLAAWAGLFWFLWISGREAFYLSTRTDWIVPIAAVLLTAATVGRLASARVVAPRPLAARRLWVTGLLVGPVGLVLVVPGRARQTG